MIKSLDDLTEDDLKDAIVLITSDSDEVYDDIRRELYERVPRKQCVELFPKPVPDVLNFVEMSNDLRYHLVRLASVQSAEFISENLPTVTMYPNRCKLMEHLFLDGLVPESGLYLEFGVYDGTSINFIASYNPTATIYGFDSFEGLPENWNFYSPAGAFSFKGKLPEVSSNVELVKGLFEQTLPDFLEKHHDKCAFIHIDCDLYSSAKQVFEYLGDRITCGTVIEFDDFFEHPNWKNGESKAFFEYCKKNNLRYEYLGYSNTGGQCAIKIVGHDSV